MIRFKHLALIVGSSLVLGACAPATPTPQTPTEPTTPSPTLESGPIKNFKITASQFTYTPNTITVNQGDQVQIELTSADVAHGFALPDYNIDQAIQPGQTATVTFTATKKGTFTFKCNLPCGPGHKDMQGTLVVI